MDCHCECIVPPKYLAFVLLVYFANLLVSNSLRFNMNEVYTLKAGSEIDPSYIVGPKQLRRIIHNISRQKCKEIDNLRKHHRDLDNQIAQLDIPKRIFLQAELKILKAEKLRTKDHIVHLLKQQEVEKSSKKLIELGSGGFGKVLFAKCVESGRERAIKIASLKDFSELCHEYIALSNLNEAGFPSVYYFGKQDILGQGPHVVMVMEILGPSVDRLLFATTLGVRGFSPYTVVRIATQLLCRLESLSRSNIVHGDIQPGNFLLGLHESRSVVHLIDFGLCTLPRALSLRYQSVSQLQAAEDSLDPNSTSPSHLDSSNSPSQKITGPSFYSAPLTGRRRGLSKVPSEKVVSSATESTDVPSSSGRNSTLTSSTTGHDRVRGTLGFVSSRVLRGAAAAERDDLESLGISLAYLLQGRLPWSNWEDSVALRMQDAISQLADVQDRCTQQQLCGESVPSAAGGLIWDIVTHARSLHSDDKPNYSALKAKALSAMASFGTGVDALLFDWEREGISWSSIDGSISHNLY